MSSSEKKPSLEEYLEMLRTINDRLQRDDIKMADALDLYRQGARIAQEADRLLSAYDAQVQIIEVGEDSDGSQNVPETN